MSDVCVVTGGGSGMGLSAALQMPKDKIIIVSGRTILQDNEISKSGFIWEELQMELKKIDYKFTVCKVTDASSINTESDFYFIGKTDEELSLVVLTKFYSYIFAKGFRAFTDVYSHIKNCTPYTTNEFALRIRWTLKMKATHNAIA